MTARELFPILSADDPLALADFYARGLGAEVSYRFPDDGTPEYVYLRLEPLGFGIARRTGDGPAGSAIALWTYVDDVDAATERLLTLGARVVAEPADQRWGERVASIEDPAGHVLHLGQRR